MMLSEQAHLSNTLEVTRRHSCSLELTLKKMRKRFDAMKNVPNKKALKNNELTKWFCLSFGDNIKETYMISPVNVPYFRSLYPFFGEKSYF